MKFTTLAALAGALMITAPASAADILYNFKFDKTSPFGNGSDPSLDIRVVVEGQATMKYLPYPDDGFFLYFDISSADIDLYLGGEELIYESELMYVNVNYPPYFEEFPGSSFTAYNRFIGTLIDENSNDVAWLSNEGVSMYIDSVHHFWQVANMGNTQYWTTVPEPATWAMLIVGFGIVGFASRQKRPAFSRS